MVKIRDIAVATFYDRLFEKECLRAQSPSLETAAVISNGKGTERLLFSDSGGLVSRSFPE